MDLKAAYNKTLLEEGLIKTIEAQKVADVLEGFFERHKIIAKLGFDVFEFRISSLNLIIKLNYDQDLEHYSNYISGTLIHPIFDTSLS